MAAVIDRPATVTTNPLFEKNSQRTKLTTGIKKNTDSILLKDNTLININKLGRELFLTFTFVKSSISKLYFRLKTKVKAELDKLT